MISRAPTLREMAGDSTFGWAEGFEAQRIGLRFVLPLYAGLPARAGSRPGGRPTFLWQQESRQRSAPRFNADDYRGEALADAMAAHGYHLQYLLYLVALHRHLKLRLPHYDYDSHIGGALYLFVRGVRPGWLAEDGAQAGVYFRRPSRADVEALDALITGGGDGGVVAR